MMKAVRKASVSLDEDASMERNRAIPQGRAALTPFLHSAQIILPQAILVCFQIQWLSQIQHHWRASLRLWLTAHPKWAKPNYPSSSTTRHVRCAFIDVIGQIIPALISPQFVFDSQNRARPPAYRVARWYVLFFRDPRVDFWKNTPEEKQNSRTVPRTQMSSPKTG